MCEAKTRYNMNDHRNTSRYLQLALALILSLAGGYCDTNLSPKAQLKITPNTQATESIVSERQTATPMLTSLASSISILDVKGSTNALLTKADEPSETSTSARYLTTRFYPSTKTAVKSARKLKLNTSSSTPGSGAHSPARLQERLAIDCDLPVLPRDSRVWRGNETHELVLPVTECAGIGVGTAQGAPDEECPPSIVSWEGSADIQSGDILIVRIADSLLYENLGHARLKNDTPEVNTTHGGAYKRHRLLLQPAVYQVTRQGHEHCDISDGMLLDITPLAERGAKLFTLYDKDLTEGVNLLIVVSDNWGSQCVRLKVTVKSDNCGESQDCSGKGVCYTNVSMEGYECQCCSGYIGPHCEERDVCNPSPCLNNGICVDLTQPLSENGTKYRCLCPYGFSGKRCEKDPCFSAPCLNGGSCMSVAVNGSTTFRCACPDGWTGMRCDLSINGGACASNPCVKGICIGQVDIQPDGPEYQCFCQPGYTGERCELEYNECESSPCKNGGTCTDRIGGFACFCGRGYTGLTCQTKVNLCEPSPCSGRRDCVDHGNIYTCSCPPGYVGDDCHMPPRSPCDNNPCAHGGTCSSIGDFFFCSCRPGYTGKFCEDDFILESVVGGEGGMESDSRGGSSVREVRMPLGLYHDRLHNVYIAAGTLGAAIAIVGVVVTACHCRVNKTYSRLLSRLSRATEPGPPHHWLQDKRAPPSAASSAGPYAHSSAALDSADMYYTLDFSDSQSSPLIQ